MRRVRVVVLALLAVALVAGCAQLPFLGGGREHGNTECFEALGRVFVRFGPRGFSGSFRWRHEVESDEVWLGGPLGQTAAHIARDWTGAILTTADQQTYRATSIEALTREGLGWSLPLVDLSYYVVGKLPPEDSAGVERDAQGRPVRAERNGWTVRWTNAQGDTGRSDLPRLNLIKDDVEIRFVVDRLDRAK